MAVSEEVALRTKDQILQLFEWLRADPFNYSTQQQMAELLRIEDEEKPPNRGLVSHAMRYGDSPKAQAPCEWFATRVAKLHAHVEAKLRDPDALPALVEFLGRRGRRFVVPPRYDPAKVMRFVGGELAEVGDVVMVRSEGNLPPRGAIVWVPPDMVKVCAWEKCNRIFARRSPNHQYCSRQHGRQARRERKP